MAERLLIVPGLGDSNVLLEKLSRKFEQNGFSVDIHEAEWKLTEENLEEKQEKLHDDIGNQDVFLLGISAGGSFVLNELISNENVKKAVNVCGRVRRGKKVFPSLDLAAGTHKVFKESVLLFERDEHKLSEERRRAIMTVRSPFDEIVPFSTVAIRGATNIVVPFPEHTLAIYATLLFYRGTISRFFKKV